MRGIVLCLLAGCDTLASGDYVGQPMITLVGTFAAAGTPASDVGGVALLWQDPSGAGGPGVAATTLPVAISFPSAFHVAVPAPPPAVARWSFVDGVALAEAYMFVVADASAPRPVPRGSDRQHVLVWADADVEDGTLAADYLGGAMAAGYHLRRFVPGDPGAAQLAMIDRCTLIAPRRACEVRRDYRLEAISDDVPMLVEVTP